MPPGYASSAGIVVARARARAVRRQTTMQNARHETPSETLITEQMARPCATCTSSPHRASIDRMIASGTSFTDIAAWLTGKGAPISRNALSRHAAHLGEAPRAPGPRPMSDDLATAIRDRVHERLAAGDIEPGIKDGLGAQRLLDQRAADFADRDLMMRIALALTGAGQPRVIVDPEVAAIEAEFRPLLGDGSALMPAIERTRERVLARD